MNRFKLVLLVTILSLISTQAFAMSGKPAKPQSAAYLQCLGEAFNYCYGAANEKFGSPYYKTTEGQDWFKQCTTEKDKPCLSL